MVAELSGGDEVREEEGAAHGRRPLVVSMAMGYGHLRAAHALAEALGTGVLHADRPPLAESQEQRLWEAARRVYEWTSRASQLPVVGGPLRRLLDAVTHIPHFEPRRDLSRPTRPVRMLGRWIDRGLGLGLARRLAEEGVPLVTSYFAPAVAVDDHRRLGSPGTGGGDGPALCCVVTDADLARAWVGRRPAETRVCYLVPSRRAAQRLRDYGVPAERVERTGFPLPGELLGGPHLPALRRDLAARLVRLDPTGTFRRGVEIEPFLGALPEAEQAGRPPRITFVVGGAGAQAELAEPLIASLAPRLHAGRLHLALVAGTRHEVAESFDRWTRAAGLEPGAGAAGAVGATGTVEILVEDTVEAYFRRFNRLLAATDVLWTKPSELTFFAALGLPLVLTRPVGTQERHNRAWLAHHDAALRAPEPHRAGAALDAWLADGSLAATAWNGFLQLPKLGLYRILDRVAGR